MSSVVRIKDFRRKPPYLHFTRVELNLLLGLYATRVSRGEWRDYAINSGPDAASFMVFRRSQEHPLFTISKLAVRKSQTKATKRGQYLVTSQQRRLSQGHDLGDVLAVFNRPMKLITG
tara:strand:- start:405 stop:758 length:354 start_codon:yes stop_codon:yes gene_type:complete